MAEEIPAVLLVVSICVAMALAYFTARRGSSAPHQPAAYKAIKAIMESTYGKKSQD